MRVSSDDSGRNRVYMMYKLQAKQSLRQTQKEKTRKRAIAEKENKVITERTDLIL